MAFRDRLWETIGAARPILELPDVLVIGSEVPNLMEPAAAATLVVSLDLDIGVPVGRHAAVKERLGLLAPRPGMPDPGPERATVAALLRRLEAQDGDR